MEQSGNSIADRKAKNSKMLQRGDEMPYIERDEIDVYVQEVLQTNNSLLAQPLGPYRSISEASGRYNRSIAGQDYALALSEYRSEADLIPQLQDSFAQPVPPYTSTQTRSDQYPVQQSGSQFLQPSASRMNHVVQKPFAGPVAQVRQRNELRYRHPSATGVSRPMSNHGSAQAAIEASLQKKRQIQSSHLSTVKKYPRQQSSSTQAVQSITAPQLPVNNGSVNNKTEMPVPKPSCTVPKPTPTECTTYRIDTRGTRIPKTEPPPQGTYKPSEGTGRTDYSDPRDFCAPTIREQKYVWNALRTTRVTFYELTHIQLRPNDMKTLYMGYNAAWNEVKRTFIQWVYENFSPDRSGPGRTTISVQNLSDDVPGYGVEEQHVIVKQPYNPKNIKYFVNGELAMNVDDLLPRLERWYGLIEDYRFSPTWPYERQRNSGGFLIQNPDCFACMHCRKNQILCYGFRERADRKCTPCASTGLSCSIEEDIVENSLIRC